MADKTKRRVEVCDAPDGIEFRVEEPKAIGRPSEFAQEIADLICDEIAKGRSVKDICADKSADFDSIPSERTIYRWLNDEANDSFRQQYARAREAQADGKFEQAWDIASAATVENVQVARLQIDTIKWQTGKLAPKKYGEKLLNEHTGADGGPITVVVNKPA